MTRPSNERTTRQRVLLTARMPSTLAELATAAGAGTATEAVRAELEGDAGLIAQGLVRAVEGGRYELTGSGLRYVNAVRWRWGCS